MSNSRKITKIVIHCSDSPDTSDIGAAEIDSWHRARGWKGIGYHYVIRRNGTVEIGRPESEVGAHVEGHNHDSIGICWVGRALMTDVQADALIALLKKKRAEYPDAGIYGHYEFNKEKTCPNISMNILRRALK